MVGMNIAVWRCIQGIIEDRNDGRDVKPWERELKRLRAQNLTLQRTALLQDPLQAGRAGSVLTRYLDALAWAVEMTDANQGRHYDDSSRPTGHESPRPNPVSAWAADLLARELRWLERQTQGLEQWVESPHPVRHGGKKLHRCVGCGGGLGRGARYCSRCGTEVRENDEGGGGAGKDA